MQKYGYNDAEGLADSEGMRVPYGRHVRTSAATIGNFMKEELALYLFDAGIEPGALFTALKKFLTHGEVFSLESSDIDSMLIYLKKESIQDFMKLLFEDTPPIEVD